MRLGDQLVPCEPVRWRARPTQAAPIHLYRLMSRCGGLLSMLLFFYEVFYARLFHVPPGANPSAMRPPFVATLRRVGGVGGTVVGVVFCGWLCHPTRANCGARGWRGGAVGASTAAP